jgi:predicted GNAT family acetyltransferase
MDWKYEEGHIYSTDENGEIIAETTFASAGNGEVDINHTYVAPSLRGKGLAGDMMSVVAAYIRDNKLKATASCSYANAWLMRHKESYADIFSEGFSPELKCNINGKH